MEASFLTSVVLPASLFIIMLGMGLSLVLDDFKRIALQPKATLIGLINQLILLPIVAFLLVSLLSISPIIAVGFMLVAACPGGVTSNLISHVSRGDTALSITLTAISSVITVVTIPLIIAFSLNHFMGEAQSIQLPLVKTITQIVAITILPVSIGMAVRNKFSDFALRMDKPVRIASTLIFVIMVIAVVAANFEVVLNNIVRLGWVSFLLIILTMSLGFGTAKIFNLNLPQRITIAVESGIQNGGLAIVIATTILNQPEISIPAAIYSLVMFIPAAFMMWYYGNK